MSIKKVAPRRRWWIAFPLNFVAPPTGFVYVGAVRVAVLMVALALVAAAMTLGLTILFPPGIYANPLGLGYEAHITAWQLIFAAGFGVHAALMTQQSRPAIRPWLTWAASFGLLALLLGGAALLKAAAPLSVFTQMSASMEPSLFEGDVVAVRGGRFYCGRVRPEVGATAVFRRLDGGSTLWMHRVVAGPGSSVEMRDGRLVVNGRPVAMMSTRSERVEQRYGFDRVVREATETLPNGSAHLVQSMVAKSEVDTTAPIQLGRSEWFVLGDSRDNAADSRYEGPVNSADVCGVGWKVLQSKNKDRVGRRP